MLRDGQFFRVRHGGAPKKALKLPRKMFWHTLALALGMSVRRAQEEIDEDEFRWWMVYNRMSPIGRDRIDYGFAQVSSTIANVNRAKGQKPYNAKDFMPQYGSKPKQTIEQMKQLLGAIKNVSRRDP